MLPLINPHSQNSKILKVHLRRNIWSNVFKIQDFHRIFFMMIMSNFVFIKNSYCNHKFIHTTTFHAFLSLANGNAFQHGVSSVLPPLPPHAAATYNAIQQSQLQQHPYHHNSTAMAMNRSNGGEY